MHLVADNSSFNGTREPYLVKVKSFYTSYLRAFSKFAQSVIDTRVIKTLSMYAMIITNKANELIKRAALNTKIDITKLKKEIYELGKTYVHKFGDLIKRKDSNEVNKR